MFMYSVSSIAVPSMDDVTGIASVEGHVVLPGDSTDDFSVCQLDPCLNNSTCTDESDERFLCGCDAYNIGPLCEEGAYMSLAKCHFKDILFLTRTHLTETERLSEGLPWLSLGMLKFEGCLQTLQWSPGWSPWWPFCFNDIWFLVCSLVSF